MSQTKSGGCWLWPMGHSLLMLEAKMLEVKSNFSLYRGRQTIQLKNEQRTWIDTSPRMIYRWSIDIWKDLNITSYQRCEIKLQWDTTSHLSEWPSLINQQTTSAGKVVEKREPSCTVGGNADWCSHCRKQYRISPPKLKMELPFDLPIQLLEL